MNPLDELLREVVAGFTSDQRDAVRADLSRWSGLPWSLFLDAPEQDVEAVRQGLLRVL